VTLKDTDREIGVSQKSTDRDINVTQKNTDRDIRLIQDDEQGIELSGIEVTLDEITGDEEWERLKDRNYIEEVEKEFEERNDHVMRKCMELSEAGIKVKSLPTQFRNFQQLRLGNIIV
jgi:hypothetical protein